MIGKVAICVVVLIFPLMLSVPLPFCFGAAMMYMQFICGVSMKSMLIWDFGQMISTTLLAAPFFMLAGNFMSGSGISTRLLDFVDSFVGRIKGGTGIVACVTCAILGAISGSSFTGISHNRTVLLLLINLLLLIVGMIVNDSTGMILCGPILLSIAASLGVPAVQLGAIMGVNLAMGGITPPYASVLYLGMRVGKCEFVEMIRPILIFILFGFVPVILLTSFWAPLSMWLPSVFGLV